MENEKKRLTYAQKYYRVHKVECLLAQKSWRKRNQDRVRLYNQQWGMKNKKRVYELHVIKRTTIANMINAVKDVPCLDCGRRFPSYVMDLDHRDPAIKSFTVSQSKTIKVSRILTEIQKCDVVCANCHRERTHTQEIARGCS